MYSDQIFFCLRSAVGTLVEPRTRAGLLPCLLRFRACFRACFRAYFLACLPPSVPASVPAITKNAPVPASAKSEPQHRTVSRRRSRQSGDGGRMQIHPLQKNKKRAFPSERESANPNTEMYGGEGAVLTGLSRPAKAATKAECDRSSAE